MASPDNLDAQAVANARAMWARDEASQKMGMEISALGLGHAVISMTVRTDMINGHGTCHGSYIFALADTAFALACNSHGPVAVASDCQISFLRPAMPDDKLTATARQTYHRGRTGIYDVAVTRVDGQTVAVFRGKSRTIGDVASKNGEIPS